MSSDEAAAQGIGLPRGRVDDLPGLQPEDSELLRGTSGRPAPGPGGSEGGVDSSALSRAAGLRFPELTPLASNSHRVNALTQYIEDLAIARGDVEEERLYAHVRLRGAEELLRGVPVVGGKTKIQAAEARRAGNPEAAREERGAKWLVERCTEQVERLRADYEAASRTYTLLSGG